MSQEIEQVWSNEMTWEDKIHCAFLSLAQSHDQNLVEQILTKSCEKNIIVCFNFSYVEEIFMK